MPLYEYECAECGRRTEVLQRFSDAPLAECPECGGPVRRLLSAPAVQFKGSGWYVTDYSGKGKEPSDKSEKAGKTEKAASSDSGKSEAGAKKTPPPAKASAGKGE